MNLCYEKLNTCMKSTKLKASERPFFGYPICEKSEDNKV